MCKIKHTFLQCNNISNHIKVYIFYVNIINKHYSPIVLLSDKLIAYV